MFLKFELHFALSLCHLFVIRYLFMIAYKGGLRMYVKTVLVSVLL